MQVERKRQRIIVDIAVTVTTVLDSFDARIIDISEHGAQLTGATLAPGAKVQIEYMGQTVYAQCMWSEVDRMGVRFPFDLTDGPLHDAMTMALSGAMSAIGPAGLVPPQFSPYAAADYPATAPRRLGTASFGRRSQH